MTSLIGVTAFVTGGGQGVGEAIASRLALAGVTRIALADRRTDQIERVAEDLAAMGVEVPACPMDLRDIATVQAAAGAAEQHFDRVDILVNAAGITDRGGLFDTTPETFDRVFDTNVRGNFFLMQAIAKGMAARKSGVITPGLTPAQIQGALFAPANLPGPID